jgi:hypothetical protein
MESRNNGETRLPGIKEANLVGAINILTSDCDCDRDRDSIVCNVAGITFIDNKSET